MYVTCDKTSESKFLYGKKCISLNLSSLEERKPCIFLVIKINFYLISDWKLLKIKYSSSFNASYHTSAKMNSTKLQNYHAA